MVAPLGGARCLPADAPGRWPTARCYNYTRHSQTKQERTINQDYDVIVVGGGPAGGTAAYYLGRAGRRVLLLEKETLPRYKTCGGAVSAGILEQFPFSFEPVVEARVKAMSYALGADMVTVPLRNHSLQMVMRSEFDAHILKHAEAEIRPGVAVRTVQESGDGVAVETSEGGRISAQYLVAADGANSIVARALGLRRRKVMAGAIEVEAHVSAADLMRFKDTPLLIFGEVGVGYLWIFPKSDHLSVGIGALHPKPGELQSTLKRVMERFAIPLEGQPHSGHPLPFYDRPEQLNTARVLLAGDAAGLVDPFSGEGIRFAIKSGRLAAEAILAARPQDYQRRVRREIEVNHRQALVMAKMVYHFPRLFFEVAMRNPDFSEALVRMVADRSGYAGLMSRTVRATPSFLVRSVRARLGGSGSTS